MLQCRQHKDPSPLMRPAPGRLYRVDRTRTGASVRYLYHTTTPPHQRTAAAHARASTHIETLTPQARADAKPLSCTIRAREGASQRVSVDLDSTVDLQNEPP